MRRNRPATGPMSRTANYDKSPFVLVDAKPDHCVVSWESIGTVLRARASRQRAVVCLECYPGANEAQISEKLQKVLHPGRVIETGSLLKPPAAIETMLTPYLGDDPVFGRMNGLVLADFFDASAVEKARGDLLARSEGLILIVGVGAALLADAGDVLVYADMARWELQKRQRSGLIGNLGANNVTEIPSLKYKRAFFVDWRAADRFKRQLWERVDFFLDTNDQTRPKLVSGELLRDGLRQTAQRPFRVAPFFDPGPWGGHWMERVCDLPKGEPNYAWCFDCVPEENSLLLGFGAERFEIPAIDLVFSNPRELLGDAVHARFGTEFPIRFDFLDTMGGGNLSLQVHPLTEYIQDAFGMNYTQDESYYLLDAGPEGTVYLGLTEDADPQAVAHELRQAFDNDGVFDADRFVNRFPAKTHDHFLIPAGTIHCSGKESMVLEISATPYIFTFKLWDWGRLGLNGMPRPIHIDHGIANIQWDRRTAWVEKNLVGRVTPVTSGEGWKEERTGLHEREFIETRRHWFTAKVPHNTNGGVNVLNLVQGEEAAVESPTRAFEPFVVHYAETFIVPAAVGPYTIRPCGLAVGTECATVKAFVRTNP
jgi:mannose-6-phosphate isomerase class I